MEGLVPVVGGERWPGAPRTGHSRRQRLQGGRPARNSSQRFRRNIAGSAARADYPHKKHPKAVIELFDIRESPHPPSARGVIFGGHIPACRVFNLLASTTAAPQTKGVFSCPGSVRAP